MSKQKKVVKKVAIAERTTCRISGEKFSPLFTLGKLYLSDFIEKHETPHYDPIELKMCLAPKSGLVQLAHTTPGDVMYRKYWYKSGTNATMTNELSGIAQKTQSLVHFKPGDIFVDIGCNDGTLFRFVEKKFIRIGFDPNNFKEESIKHADIIVNNYFTFKEYSKTKHGKKKAKIITSIAMFYDLENPHAFVKDVKNTLDKDGLWVIQMSYLPLMLKQLAFDNICHEHLKYYSLKTLKYLLEKNGMKIVDCELNDVNGGSFRIYIRHKDANASTFATAPYRDVADMRVESILKYEESLRLNDKKIYIDFWKKIQALKKETVDFIKKEKKKGKVIWGYGASTKGNTLLQWYGLDNTLIDGIAERSPAKFGLKTAGTNIPIYSEEEMRKAKPDYLLVLPWHFINEFKEREEKFLAGGGKLIVPCPKFEIIGKN
ncbi:MAG: NDP-hexose 3-C-methyltransferase TylCIII [Parcubacteria bacterium C7867-005]|nr:MAG: NDP-hexose 3-C-methyltransferase TylCIII [Parcubacteria bacterium C7867-005]